MPEQKIYKDLGEEILSSLKELNKSLDKILLNKGGDRNVRNE